jgi:hypothetical protein
VPAIMRLLVEAGNERGRVHPERLWQMRRGEAGYLLSICLMREIASSTARSGLRPLAATR